MSQKSKIKILESCRARYAVAFALMPAPVSAEAEAAESHRNDTRAKIGTANS